MVGLGRFAPDLFAKRLIEVYLTNHVLGRTEAASLCGGVDWAGP